MYLRKPALHLSEVLRLPQRHLHLPDQEGQPMSYFTANLTREEDEVRDELARQDATWGEQGHPDGTALAGDNLAAASAKQTCQLAASKNAVTWRDILWEEVAEAFAEDDPDRLLAELLQVEAVARQWRMAIRRRAAAEQDGEVSR